MNKLLRVAAILCCGLWWLSGCGGDPQVESIKRARLLLQTNRTADALDALAQNDLAEAHYLKAVGLQRQHLDEAAMEQIREALALEPDDPRYRAFRLMLELNAKQPDAAEKLIDLHKIYPSSGAVALFATPAFIAKQDLPGALKSFQSALTMIDECPEFMFFALNVALSMKQDEAAERLLDKLQAVAPDDPKYLRDLLRAAVRGKLVKSAEKLLAQLEKVAPDDPDFKPIQIESELLLGQTGTARKLAQEMADKNPLNEEAQLVFAETLLKSPASEENEKILKQMVKDFPRQPEFHSKYALYLARHDRMKDAVDFLNQAFVDAKSKLIRSQILHLAVGIPLEAEDADLAAVQVEKYRAAFSAPMLAAYFDGRVAYLRKDYPAALRKFQEVINSGKNAQGGERALVAEALVWAQRTLAAQLAAQKLHEVSQSLEGLENLEQEPVSEKPKQKPPTKPESKPEPADKTGE